VAVAQRLSLVLVGLLAGVILAESGMRIAGTILRRGQELRNASVLRQRHDVRIVCIGESTTEGSGEFGRYPEMLQAILNREAAATRFAVVNQGMSGATTTQVMAMLEDRVEVLAADLLVVMMGINDPGKTDAWGSVLSPGKDRWYGEWRLYKLYRMIRAALLRGETPVGGRRPGEHDRLGDATPTPGELLVRPIPRAWLGRMTPTPVSEAIGARLDEVRDMIAADQFDRARRRLRALQREFHTLDAPPVLQALIYRRMGMAEDAHRLLLTTAQKLPGASIGFYADLALSHADRGEYATAIEILSNAIRVLVDPSLAHEMTHYSLILAGFYDRAGDTRRAEDTYRFIAEDVNRGRDVAYEDLIRFYERHGRPEDAAHYRRVQERIRYEYVSPVTTASYAALHRLVRSRGTPVLAVQYPTRSVDVLRRLLPDDPGITFLDNARFVELVRRDGYAAYFSDRFAGDFGHFTRWGNCVLATRIAGAILESYLGRPPVPGAALAEALENDGCALPDPRRP